ncbi:MAG: hypothetical protein KC466_01240, partial [Myxococcales bacterium]|nr:hypothetical protein [Myxococcales bacterium]
EGAAAFFTDDEARGLFRRRLRYLAARWSAMSNLLAWELWNEVDLPEQPPQAAVVAWHREMAGELRSHDPMGHLITTSTGGVVGIVDALLGRSLAAPLWELPEIDFTQLHLYAFPGLFPIDFATQMGDFLRPLAPFGKPRLIAEAGVDFRGPAETLAADPTSAGIHDILWSGIFAETFGTGMTWWWDNVVDPEDLYAQFGAVATFVRGVAFDRESFAPGGAHAEAPDHLLQALALRGERTALVWIKNVRHRWFPPETGLDPSPIDGGVLSLDGLADGPWEAQWIDAYDGIPILSASALASDGALTLPIPEFSRDVALRLERQP